MISFIHAYRSGLFRVLLGLTSIFWVAATAHAQTTADAQITVNATAGGASPSLKVLGGFYTFSNSYGELTGTGTLNFTLPLGVDAPTYLVLRVKDMSAYDISVDVPGYNVVMDGIVRTHMAFAAVGSTEIMTAPTLVLIKKGAQSTAATQPVGESGQVAWGGPPTGADSSSMGPWSWPYLTLHLGNGLDGAALTPLKIPLIKRDNYSRTQSAYHAEDVVMPFGPGMSVASNLDANGSFVVDLPQARVAYTVNPSAGTFSVAFSPPGTSAGVFVQYDFDFLTWTYYNGGDFATTGNGNKVKITKTVTGGNTYETVFESSYGALGIRPLLTSNAIKTNTWWIEQWHQQGQSVVSTMFGTRSYGPHTSPSSYDLGHFVKAYAFTDDFVVKPGGAGTNLNAAVTSTRHEYSYYLFVDGYNNHGRTYLAKVIEGYGEGNFVTRNLYNPYPAYQDNPWGETQNAVSGSVFPTGATRIEVIPEDKSRIIYESWQNASPSFDLIGADGTPAHPVLTTNSLSRVTTHTPDTPYGSSPWMDFGWYASEVATRNGVTLKKSTMTYDAETWGAAEKLVKITRTDYKDASTIGRITVTREFRPDTPDAALRGRPYSIELPDGTKQSFAYEHLAGNGLRVTTLNGLASGGTQVTSITGTAGTITIDSVGLVASRSTKIVDTYANALLASRVTYVCSSGSAFDEIHPIASETFGYSADGRLATHTALNNASYSAIWVGTRKTQESDETGFLTTYTYDTVDRVLTATRAAITAFSLPAMVTNFEYDAAGRTTATRIGATGGEQLSTTTSYDLSGRMKSTTVHGGLADSTHLTPAGVTTTFTPDATLGLRKITESSPAGTKVAEMYADGRLKSLTGDVVEQHHTYEVDTNGRAQHTVRTGSSTGRSRVTTYDLLGRVYTEETQSAADSGGTRKPIVTTSEYNNKGLLSRVFVKYDPAGANLSLAADTLTSYDAFGIVTDTGSDTDGNGSLLPSTTDRYTTTATDYYWDTTNLAWWARKSNTVYTTNGSSAGLTTTTVARLSNFPSGVLSQADTIDTYNVRTSVSSSFSNAPTSRTETVLLADGTKQEHTTAGGVPVREKVIADNNTAQISTAGYDSLGRRTSQTDARNLVSSADYYTGTTQVYRTYGRNSANTGNNTLSTSTYDSAGRVASKADATTKEVAYGYHAKGWIQDESGAGAYRVHRDYNQYGEPTGLSTYRDGTTADITTWVYDAETGWLKSKTDASSQTVTYDYSYSSPYKIVTRKWARTLPNSSTKVTTTSKYLLTTGDLDRVEYNDGTPTVAYVYTRTGKIDAVTDATGARDLVYDHEQLSAEGLDASWYGGLVLTQLFDVTSVVNTTANLIPGRYAGYKLGVTSNLERELKETLTYDDFGRVNNVTAAYVTVPGRGALTVSGTYAYQANTSFWNSLTQGSFTQARGLETGRNVIGSMTASWNSAPLAQYTYTTNAAFQRTASLQQGSAFDGGYGEPTFARYAYTDVGELKDAEHYFGSDTEVRTRAMAGRGHHFTYDTAGNRLTAGIDTTETVTYMDGAGHPGANNLNQVKVRANLKTRVSGVADATATLTVDGNTLSRNGTTRYWDIALSSTDQYRQFSVSSSLSGTPISVWALFRPATETLTYDLDGNVLSDGVWNYTWNAENRLTQMTNIPAQSWGMPVRVLWFVYDYLGRRVAKTTYDNGTTTIRRYIYQDWNLIAELDNTLAVVRSHAWGLDLQGSLHSSGGVGALVLSVAHTSSSLTAYHIASDANGNVTALVNSTGSPAAAYEYDPYGQLLRKSGPEATINPFRFSTKFVDQETGLIYYGYRYYDPGIGRFINRDTIGEAGGNNLYAFVSNNPINRWDYLGQRSLWESLMAWWSGTSDTFDDTAGQEVFSLPAFKVEDRRPSAEEVKEHDQEEHKDAWQQLKDELEKQALDDRPPYPGPPLFGGAERGEMMHRLMMMKTGLADMEAEAQGYAPPSKNALSAAVYLSNGRSGKGTGIWGAKPATATKPNASGVVPQKAKPAAATTPHPANTPHATSRPAPTTAPRPADKSSMTANQALDRAVDYLGPGYRRMDAGVYVSADGKRLVRMTDSDLAKTDNHAGAPHMNFEEGTTIRTPNLNKPSGFKETFKSEGNSHIFLIDEK
jgi:RHS repeat-associated protein